MVVSIVSVLAALEQRGELDCLVGLVVMHGPDVQTRQPQHQAGRQRDRYDENRGCRTVARKGRACHAVARKGEGGPAGHFGEP